LEQPFVEPQEPLERREVRFLGRVQGVGFRYAARSIAQLHPVTGYVKNLSDGSVELVIEGRREDVSATLRAVRTEMGRHIREVRETSLPATGRFSNFDVRY
jgi:acylphosphatase